MKTVIHWIPVDVRLPEYGESVLTVDDQFIIAEAKRTFTNADGEHWTLCWPDDVDEEHREWFKVKYWAPRPSFVST